MRVTTMVVALLAGVAGCGGGGQGGGGSDLGTADGGGVVALRGRRYCEVLLATLMPPNVHVEVYNTEGLNDCPDAAWQQLDPTTLQMQTGATMVLLNGPRYWTLDAFVQATLVDPTPRTFGTIAMRHAANIDLPLAGVSMLGAPYTPHMIERKTVVRFAAGQPVYELVDATGRIFDMQSYSVQKTPQTMADLATLGARLTLPAGWMFRTRTLATDLEVTAVGGTATVVQDDFANTYQLSQQ